MLTCNDAANLLLDSLYDLLDEADALQLREHLAGCAACRAALAEAEAQQQLLARAAQVYAEVPLFTAPAAEAPTPAPVPAPVIPDTAVTAATPLPAADPLPETLPMPPRTTRRRVLRWLTAAAVLLLGAGGGFVALQYQRGLAERQTTMERTRREVNAVEVRIASAQRDYDRAKAALPGKLRENHLQVEMAGPADYRRDAASRYRVAASDLDGKPTTATVTARLMEPGRAEPVFKDQVEVQGTGDFTLPAGLGVNPKSAPYLQVEARRGSARGEVAELLLSGEPPCVSHVALNKAVFRVGDILFFRTLTVERFSLKPVSGELQLACTLIGPGGQPVRTVYALTRNGVAGGEIALTADLPVGEYTLRIEDRGVKSEVRELVADNKGGGSKKPSALAPRTATVEQQQAAIAKARFPTETRRLTLVREEAPQLHLDRYLYTSGETVNAAFRSRLQNGAVVPNQPITVEAEAGGKAISLSGAAPGKPLQMRTDNLGRAAFQLPLPATLPTTANVRMKVHVHDGKREEKVEVAVPVAAEAAAGLLSVELFPEGGDLVAGVPNRVYFQARDHRGQPAALTGVLLDRKMREIVAVRGAAEDAGLGMFEFTPEPGEVYTLRARAPGTVEMRTALRATRSDGVALSIPHGVGGEGEQLRVAVRDPRGRRLLVLAECRGRIVDQQTVTADRAGKEVLLAPVPGTRGVVRVTACAVGEGRLLPLAERLVYRVPAEYLRLSVADRAGTARTEYRPGERVGMTVKVTTETGAPTSAVLLGAFVDRKWLAAPGQPPELSPAAQFYLSREVRHPEELDDAEFLLADTAQARRNLDLFLGTHGWRRFVPQGERDGFTAVAMNQKQTRAAALAGAPAVLLTDNRAKALEDYRSTLARRQDELRGQALQQRRELTEERAGKVETAGRALSALREYEELPREYLWRGLVGVVLVLFTLGCFCLAAGVLRFIRSKGSSRASFSVAFVALALCVGAYSLTVSLRDAQPAAGTFAGMTPRELPPLDAPPEGKVQGLRAAQVRKLYTVTDADQTTSRRATEKGDLADRSASELQKKTTLNALRALAQTERNREEASSRQAGDAQFAQRFGALSPAAKGKGKVANEGTGSASAPGMATGGAQPPTFVPRGDMVGGRGGDAKNAVDGAKAAESRGYLVLREYAHRQPVGAVDYQDMLFWHPALDAKDGTAQLEFDLSSNVTTYQLWLYGHSPSGRLGVYRGTVETWR